MKSLPADVVAYRRTREFSQATLPAALRSAHNTKPGVWALICVLEGRLRYRILTSQPEEHVLTPDRSGVVEPGVPHEVEPLDDVRFLVEFHRVAR